MIKSTKYMCDNTDMKSDPFSDILQLVRAQSVLTGSFSAGGRWSIRFAPMQKIRFFVITKGSCILHGGEGDTLLHVETGDVLLLSRHPVTLSNDNDIEPVDATSLYAENCEKVVQLGDGEAFSLLGGYVLLDPVSGGLLADALPSIIHISTSLPESNALKWLVEQLIWEKENEFPGNLLARSHLSQLIFVRVLRLYLASSPSLTAGWLRLIGDARLAPALKLIHGDPGRSWQLEGLARACAMSRTAFAVHFKATAGIAPLAYLIKWRMRLAEQALREEDISVGSLASRLGYSSESSFSNAFKRTTGKSPRDCRKLGKNGEPDSLKPAGMGKDGQAQ